MPPLRRRAPGQRLKATSKAAAAARRLFEAHEARRPFAPLPAELAPASAEEGYAIQDAFVALRAQKLGAIAGYKVALASEAMRRFVGVAEPQLELVRSTIVPFIEQQGVPVLATLALDAQLAGITVD